MMTPCPTARSVPTCQLRKVLAANLCPAGGQFPGSHLTAHLTLCSHLRLGSCRQKISASRQLAADGYEPLAVAFDDLDDLLVRAEPGAGQAPQGDSNGEHADREDRGAGAVVRSTGVWTEMLSAPLATGHSGGRDESGGNSRGGVLSVVMGANGPRRDT